MSSEVRKQSPERAVRPCCSGRSRAVTLVEVLIAVALIAILSGAVLVGSGALGSSRERAAATLVVSAVRLGLARANTTGRPARLVFDLDAHKLSLEETSSLVLARETSEGVEGDAAEDEEGEATKDAVTELENRAEAEAKGIIEGPRAPRPEFTAVQQFKSDEEDGEDGRALGRGVSFRSVQTEHDATERTRGRVYLYFWPGGETEHAVVHLGRDDGEGLTVVVSSLTGRAKIEKGKVELPERRSDGQISERDEE